MKLLDENGTALTYWTDKHEGEWPIRIKYTFQEFEPEQPNPDLPGVGPGCEAAIVDMQVERMESILIMGAGDVGSEWVLFTGATDKEEAAWAVEIHELINQQGEDDRG